MDTGARQGQEAVPALEAIGLHKRFGHIVAVDSFDIQLYRGKCTALVGDNGAGKSTIIKLLSGSEHCDAGHIMIDGQSRKIMNPQAAHKLGIETVHQDSTLCPGLSVIDNLFLGREAVHAHGLWRRLRRRDVALMERQAREALDALGITIPDLRIAVEMLSGGQRQAVAVGRSLLWGRSVVIFDEPTNHLGVREVRDVLQVIARLKSRGVAVLMVSHALPHVFEVSDEIIVLRLGRRVASLSSRHTSLNEVVSLITGSS